MNINQYTKCEGVDDVLHVLDLKKQFSTHEVVKGITLNIKQGESYGLLGPNGAGKSTTISMICGLIKPTSGSITIADINMIKQPKKAQQKLGIVPQDIALYLAMTARENLMFWGRMYGLKGLVLRARVDEVLNIIGLYDRADDKVETFSGGMKRRVNIGAAILHQPDLLIMDEPTVGIDPQSRNHILETVKSLNSEGMTIIYTSHYMEEVEYLCTRIGIMDHGELICEGTLPELKNMLNDGDEIIIQLAPLERHDEQFLQKLQYKMPQLKFSLSNHVLRTISSHSQLILSTLLNELTALNQSVTAIEIKEANLENVFLHLTGRSLRD